MIFSSDKEKALADYEGILDELTGKKDLESIINFLNIACELTNNDACYDYMDFLDWKEFIKVIYSKNKISNFLYYEILSNNDLFISEDVSDLINILYDGMYVTEDNFYYRKEEMIPINYLLALYINNNEYEKNEFFDDYILQILYKFGSNLEKLHPFSINLVELDKIKFYKFIENKSYYDKTREQQIKSQESMYPNYHIYTLTSFDKCNTLKIEYNNYCKFLDNDEVLKDLTKYYHMNMNFDDNFVLAFRLDINDGNLYMLQDIDIQENSILFIFNKNKKVDSMYKEAYQIVEMKRKYRNLEFCPIFL